MRLKAVIAACVLSSVACASGGAPSAIGAGIADDGDTNDMAGGGTSAGGTSPFTPGNGGKSASGGVGSSGGSTNGGKPAVGEGGVLANGGAANAPHPPATGTPGVWEEVTAGEMDSALFSGPNAFGVGNVVADPARPTDIYAGGYGSIWKSTDYGLTWKKLDSNPNPPYLPLGHVLAVAGTTPATLWMANVVGEKHVFRSRDGGLTFELTGTIPQQPDAASLYSIVVDPYNANHLLTGLHEQDGVLESKDGGDTWAFVVGAGFPAGGKSWFPYFVDVGDPEKTRDTWFAIAQDGGSAVMTSNAGQTWTKPAGLEDLQHPHGGSGLFQRGETMFVAGVNGPGTGVYRSTDTGASWTKVADGSGAVVWGSEKNVYAMWGWACGGCTDGAQYQTSPQPGDQWATGTVPARLNWGPNSVAITSDGTHSIFVGSMWGSGLWRYVEP